MELPRCRSQRGLLPASLGIDLSVHHVLRAGLPCLDLSLCMASAAPNLPAP